MIAVGAIIKAWVINIIIDTSKDFSSIAEHTDPETLIALLLSALFAASSERKRALIYAQAGLCYDALEAISTAHGANPNDRSVLDDRLLLLDRVGLTQVAAQERQRLTRTPVQ